MEARYPLHPTRRTVLGATAAAVAGATVLGPFTAAPVRAENADASEFESLRDRWRNLLTGGELDTDDARLSAALEELEATAENALKDYSTSAPLWPDLPFASDAGNVALTLGRLRDIALAWATEGTAISGDDSIATGLVESLRVVYDKGYNPSRAASGNWWFWEIGVPTYLTDVLALLYDIIPDDLRDALISALRHFAPDPGFRGRGQSLAETGANRVDKSLRCALRGIIDDSGADIALARDTLGDRAENGRHGIFTYVTSGDGFYEDGSFVQHGRLPYAGTYGNVALAGISNVLALLMGSTWEIQHPDIGVVLDAPEKTFAPFIWQGVMMDTVRGRAVSREGETAQSNGLGTAHSLILLATSVSEPYRNRYLELARGWLERTPGDPYATASVPQIARAIAAESSGIDPAPEAVGLTVFADQERAVHRRESWAFTVSTSSKRIGRYEWGNRENATGWYQGDGATYLMLADDADQTDDHYWPTVDPYRLPGTTVEMSERASGIEDGTGIPPADRAWAGGTSVKGQWGVHGMDHANHDDSLVAKKSWFMLDDLIIALGAGVTGTSGAPVETTVENRNLHENSPAITVDDAEVIGDLGEHTLIDSPEWAHIADVGGYIFLDANLVRFSRDPRSGAWRDINAGADTGGAPEIRDRTYATFSILHGTDPDKAAYAYALAPTASKRRTRTLAHLLHKGTGLTVHANDNTLQSISLSLRPGKVYLANAYRECSASWLTTDGPASVAVAHEQRTITICISDPSRTIEDTVRVTLADMNASEIDEADSSVSVLGLQPITLEVAVGETRGHTHGVTLRR